MKGLGDIHVGPLARETVGRKTLCVYVCVSRGGLEILYYYTLGGLFETKHRLVSVSSLYQYSFLLFLLLFFLIL